MRIAQLTTLVIASGVLAGAAYAGTPVPGIRIGSGALHSYAELSATHESNVYKTQKNEISDTYVEPEIGVRFSSSSEPARISVIGNLFYSRREYADEDDLNFDTFGDTISMRYHDEDTYRIELIQSFRRVSDNDRHASDIEDSILSADMVQDIHTLNAQRDIHQAGASISRKMSDKLDGGLSFRIADMKYDEDQYLNLKGYEGRAEAAYRVTDKTSSFLHLIYGRQSQQGLDDDASLATARLGLKTRGSDKLQYRAAGGIQRYHRPAVGDDESDVTFNFEVAADWFMTEKITLRGGARNGTQLSSLYSGNGLDYTSGWVGAGYRWSPQVMLSVRGIIRQDRYFDPIMAGGKPIDREDVRMDASARIDYIAPSGMLRAFLGISSEHVDSNIDSVDYANTRVILGTTIQY